jgi:HEPN domain-containing protein
MADRDWKSVLALQASRQFVHALFFSHLVTEKLLKAHWLADNEEVNPPKTHDLEYLYNQTNLTMDPEQVDLLRIMNSWNIEGRYQDYKDKFYKNTTAAYVDNKLKQVDGLRQWLQYELQKRK